MKFNFGKFFRTSHFIFNIGVYVYFLFMLGYCRITEKNIEEYMNVSWWFIFFMLDIWYNTTVLRSNSDKDEN